MTFNIFFIFKKLNMLRISNFILATMIYFIFFNSTVIAESLTPHIDGYSPVSYFTENKAERGKPEFSVTHKGKLYYLTSAEQIEIFNQNPDKYRPRYDICPYSLTLGKKVPIDPTNFKVVADTLLLFHKSDLVDGRALWNNNKEGLTDQELIERADKKYTLFEF